MTKLYCIDVSCFEDRTVFEKYITDCSPYRQNKLQNLRFEKDKLLSLGGAVLLNIGLKEYGFCEKQMKYGTEENGKPFFENAPEIHFNISHSGKKVLVGFSDDRIGVDIQKITDHKSATAKKFFSEKEFEFLTSQNTKDKQNEVFSQIWALKESYIKFTGKGFATSINSFSFDLSDGINFSCLKEYPELYFGQLKNIDGYAAAYCIKHKQIIEFNEIAL